MPQRMADRSCSSPLGSRWRRRRASSRSTSTAEAGTSSSRDWIPGRARTAVAGPLMKLRHTPLQLACGGPEEPTDPRHAVSAAAEGAAGLTVLALELHSRLAPAAAAVRALWPKARIAYAMADGGALPLALPSQASTWRCRPFPRPRSTPCARPCRRMCPQHGATGLRMARQASISAAGPTYPCRSWAEARPRIRPSSRRQLRREPWRP